MGPMVRQKNPTSFFQVTLVGAGLICGLLLGSLPVLAQADGGKLGRGGQRTAGTNCRYNALTSGQAQGSPAMGSISGTVLDATGAPVSGAEVKLTRVATTPVQRLLPRRTAISHLPMLRRDPSS